MREHDPLQDFFRAGDVPARDPGFRLAVMADIARRRFRRELAERPAQGQLQRRRRFDGRVRTARDGRVAVLCGLWLHRRPGGQCRFFLCVLRSFGSGLQTKLVCYMMMLYRRGGKIVVFLHVDTTLVLELRRV